MCVLQQYQYLTLEAYVSGTFPTSALGDAAARVVPGVVNTLVGMAFSDVYRALSQRMTEWENHQTQAEYLQHLTYKLIVFDFFGRFGSLFYTAFYLQLLRKQVYIQLLMSFTKDNLVEIVMPRALRRLTSLVRHMIRRESNYLPGVHSILSEADMVKYTSTYVDYYKMFSQFAFVFLFGPVVPLAPLIAFFGNLLEMLVVGYKLTVIFQRPLKIGHEGIGIWEPAFRAIRVPGRAHQHRAHLRREPGLPERPLPALHGHGVRALSGRHRARSPAAQADPAVRAALGGSLPALLARCDHVTE
ncbi:hypothetical protein MTO96_010221 [Rhipicephalus appendiculatus]